MTVIIAAVSRWSGTDTSRRRAIAGAAVGWALGALMGTLLGGCATPPAPEAPPAPPAPIVAPAPACPACEDRSAEIARLQEELAHRETELRELRAQQRDQTKALQETAKQAARAKGKLRRLATPADAASYLAEVEVALETARSPGAKAPLLALAQEVFQSSSALFAQGDYAAAMDVAAQAEQLAAIAGDNAGARGRHSAEVAFDMAIPLRPRIDAHLRRQPRDKARSIGVVPEGSPVVARAYRNGWLKVETDEGRSGWMYQALLGAR